MFNGERAAMWHRRYNEDHTEHDSLERLASMGKPSHDPSSSTGSDDATISPPKRDTSERASDGTDVSGGGERETIDSHHVAEVVIPARRVFGEYTDLVEVARGGMGVVYRARQTRLNRTVALKMILAGQLASDEDVQRFYAEAEAAAHLDHPGIVPIFDIGQHQGQHFFSMGFVEGKSLAQQVAAGLPDAGEATELMIQIGQAVHYAHEQGVVHRDLKPANVLIDADGKARITDFGLAKRIDSDSQLTGTGQILGTPGYMAPEQAAGRTDDVGPLADVYALGAILYCLLTGRPPFQAANPVDTILQVLDSEPIPPRQLNPMAPLDLETICLECLRKEAPRRYASAADFVADLKRFERNEPIVARPVGMVERTVKWIRRRPTVSALIAAVVVSLVGGAAVSLRLAQQWRLEANEAYHQAQVASAARLQTQRALASEKLAHDQVRDALQAEQTAERHARQAIDNYISAVTDELLLREAEFRPLRERLLGNALEYYRQFVREQTGASSRQELVGGLTQLARINDATGSVADAAEVYQQAITVAKQLVDQNPDSVEHRTSLAQLHNWFASLQSQLGQHAITVTNYEAAIEIWQQLRDTDPEDERLLFGSATAINNLGEYYRRRGDSEAAHEMLQQALSIKKELVRRAPENRSYQENLGNSLSNLGILYLEYFRDFGAAGSAFDQALEIRTALATANPDESEYWHEMANTLYNRGSLLGAQGDDRAAVEVLVRARDIQRRIARENPHYREYLFGLAKTLNNLGLHFRDLKQWEEAGTSIREAFDLKQRLVELQPFVVSYRHGLQNAASNLVDLHKRDQDLDAAMEVALSQVDQWEWYVQQRPKDTGAQRGMALSLYLLGDLNNLAGNVEQALSAWRREVEIRDEIIAAEPNDAGSHTRLGGNLNNVAMLQVKLGQLDDAAQNYRRAIDHQVEALDLNPESRQARQFLVFHYRGLINAHRELDRPEDVVATALEFRPHCRQAVDLYNLACNLALASDGLESSAAAEASDHAMETLTRAWQAGFRDLRQLRDDPDLDCLRDRPEFQQLLKSPGG